ncbi:MAG TPA: hypothetical protein VMF03_13930 [Steroidobacteraceae bacterium]|nr:hypothetical protein [Steroidobacteraceae bacterium]
MVRRPRPADPLLPVPQATWLVVHDMLRRPLEWRQLAPGADLRAILTHEREERLAAGWDCDEIGRVCSFFFAVRKGVRIQVGIGRYDPAGPGPPGHSDG